ncbi:MAG: N-acetyltransferase [Clostridiales bacterium]|nr:N-acetyltransferase [Clostridiales bacterium]
MTNSKKIRLVKENDYISLLEIYGPFVRDTSVSFEYVVPTIDEFKKRINNISKIFPWLVCEVNGKVVGYAYASKHRERAAYQWSVDVSIYVAPEYHRNYIAKALYTALIKILRAQGYFNAYAIVALPNEKSEGFHKALGFVPIGVYHNVGYKFDKWHDVKCFELKISEHFLQPKSPKPITEICETKEFNEILDNAADLIKL